MLSDLDPDPRIYLAQLVQRSIAKVAQQHFLRRGRNLFRLMRVCLGPNLAKLPRECSQHERRERFSPTTCPRLKLNITRTSGGQYPYRLCCPSPAPAPRIAPTALPVAPRHESRK